MGENWKPIPGYEGIYEASDLGRIRSADGKTTHSARHGICVWKQRVLKPKLKNRKKSRVKEAHIQLYKGKVSKTCLVARLVAMAWCDGYSDGMTVNHINGNPLDNRVSNLEWVSLADNIRHAFKNGLNSCAAKTFLEDVETGDIFEFASMANAGLFLNRNTGYISNCLKTHRTPSDSTGRKYRVSYERVAKAASK